MHTLAHLEAQAATLKASNTAKYKAMGYDTRTEIEIHGNSGAYIRTAVVYSKGEANVGAFILKERGSVSQSRWTSSKF